MANNSENKTLWYNRFWFTRNLCWLVIAIFSCYIDIKNFFQFRKEIKNLAMNPQSTFNKYGLKVNWLGNIVYCHKLIDNNRMIAFDDRLKNNYLVEVTQLEHDYLFHELNWGEFLLTNFIEFSDENGNQSGCYGVTFTFTPISLGNPRILKYLVFYLVFFGTIIWMFRHWIMFGLNYAWNFIVNGFQI